MKYLIHTIAFLLLLTTTACGDFFLFEDESDIWDGVSMRVLCDSTYVMEGDTMALNVAFTPMNPDDGSVYWLLPDTITAKVRDNKLIAKNAGELDLVAISNNGRISDTVRVTVFERWNTERLEYSNMLSTVKSGTQRRRRWWLSSTAALLERPSKRKPTASNTRLSECSHTPMNTVDSYRCAATTARGSVCSA